MQIIKAGSKRILSRALGYTRAAWRTEGQRSAAGIDKKGISMTMVITLKFDNLITARKATGHPDGTHTGLGAGVHHPDFIHAGHHLPNQLGHLHLNLGRCSKRS